MNILSKKRVAIYDLDNTLIDTENLKELRSKREWKTIYNSFHLSYLNPKIKVYIEKLNRDIFNEVVIVTSSPKVYAEKLLKYHNFLSGVKIIGYHDTVLRKPDPSPYLKALESIEQFDEIYIFGDQESDFIAAEKLKEILIDKKIFKVACNWYYENELIGADRVLDKAEFE